MSEEQKPDGWVAWHPKCGIAVESFVKTEDQMFRSWIEACTDVALKEEGWRIRPVKIVFLDEVKDE